MVRLVWVAFLLADLDCFLIFFLFFFGVPFTHDIFADIKRPKAMERKLPPLGELCTSIETCVL